MKARGRAGTHSTVIEAAEALVSELDRIGRVSRGVIRANAKASGRSVKVLPLEGALRLTVVAKGSKQEFHVYNVSVEQIRTILGGREFRSFETNFPE